MTWDRTVVPCAEVNEYVTIARKKENEWYVGTINNSTARTIEIPLHFLEKGTYTVTIYKDASDVDKYPNHLVKEVHTLTAKDRIRVSLASDGGCAMEIRPL